MLGLILRDPQQLAAARAHLNGGAEFTRPAHGALWSLIGRQHDNGRPIDPITLNALALKDTALRAALRTRPTFLIDLVTAGGDATPDAGHYARIVHDAHERREIIALGTRLVQFAQNPAHEVEEVRYQAIDWIEAEVAKVEQRAARTVRAADIDEFLGGDTEEHYDWLIPGVLERQDRVILTASEGAGKSHLGRQLAVQVAMGLHPFTGELHPPARVLVLDLENPANLVRREIRGLRIRAGADLEPDTLRVEVRTQGIDLADTPADRQWLTELVTDARPDLIITGPIYKMADGDPNEEKSAKPVALFLDRLRVAHGCAIWLEAHVGNETQGQRRRPERPFGWSGWRRWPEFGLYLSDTGELKHWRGDRDQRQWPTHLMRGGQWPFRPASTPTEMHWVRIQQAIHEAGEPLSQREIRDVTGLSQPTVSRTITAYSQQYAALVTRYQIEEGDPK